MMQTMPMDGAPADPMAADPLAQDMDTDDGGYRIVIDVRQDGTFMVGKDGDDTSMKPADSIKEALTIALEIQRADGKASAEAQFDAGFAGREG